MLGKLGSLVVSAVGITRMVAEAFFMMSRGLEWFALESLGFPNITLGKFFQLKAPPVP